MSTRMPDEPHLDLAAKLLALSLENIGDDMVSESWRASEVIVRINESNQVVSTSIEVCAFLLHVLSRHLPIVEGDCLNDFVYSPIVRYTSLQMGCLVEEIQEQGSFSTSVFSGDAIEEEMLQATEARGQEYATLPYKAVPQHASRLITDLVGRGQSAPHSLITEKVILRAVEALDFAGVSRQMQECLTPELIAYLRGTQ